MMSLNGNLFVRSLCFMVVYVGFTMLAGRYGDIQLAVSSILMKLFMLFSFFVDGFAYAGEALVGKAYGERTKDEGQETTIPRLVRMLFNWSIGVGILFTLFYMLCGMQCIGLLTDDIDVIAAAQPYLGWLIAMPIVSTLAFMWDGIYVGATAGEAIRNSMIWAAVAFVGVYLLGEWGVRHADCLLAPLTVLFAAYFAHLIARVVYLTAKWPIINR